MMLILFFFPLVEQTLNSVQKFEPEHMLVSIKSATDIAQKQKQDKLKRKICMRVLCTRIQVPNNI